ncbi:MAG: hypothetical protein ACLP19_12475, partial [Xanthobacteraceae bacterium]
LHAVQRALPDCEVLLHSPSTLSPIVARRKWLYIRVANQEQGDVETPCPRQSPEVGVVMEPDFAQLFATWREI